MQNFATTLLSASLALVCSDACAETEGELSSVAEFNCERILDGNIPCIERSEIKIETVTYRVPGVAVSWKCNYDILTVEYVNTANYKAEKVIVEGVATGEQHVEQNSFLPRSGQSDKVIVFDTQICENNEEIEIYLEYQLRSGGECVARPSNSDLRMIREKCEKVIAEEDERETIFNNCVVAKSKNIDSSALYNVRLLCAEIAQSPSLWHRLRWGN